ncbi:hypothetical protein GBAR_LOCUS17623 [Geodia barretti]|uniref:Uncharacterized protein n=1 Tax=Geodia barretti TaxID=519541 RepID=A0AA35WYC4_GEOBA|nr:hypothetical protein GBAR_LOCUS17623 [Geodia barretti]
MYLNNGGRSTRHYSVNIWSCPPIERSCQKVRTPECGVGKLLNDEITEPDTYWDVCASFTREKRYWLVRNNSNSCQIAAIGVQCYLSLQMRGAVQQ